MTNSTSSKLSPAEWLATPDARIDIDRERSKRSLAAFVKRAWHVIEPSTPYVHGWVIDAICAHLEAVSRGEITRLLLNVPPGFSKSLLVGVFWPAWEWGPLGKPQTRYMAASHEITLAIRDNRRMRLLVESDWFQARWPIKMAGDQNAKMRFENEATGFRLARSITSLTGERASRLLIDDPHSTETAESETERETSVRVFRESATSRLTDPQTSAIVVVMQRLNEGDISGWILENSPDYLHVMYPMRFEADRACKSSFYPDPRTVEGELIFPERFPLAVVERDERTMGQYAVASQFQQRPSPREGGLFKVDRIEIIEALPQIEKWVRAWDLAGTEGGGARTAGVLMGKRRDGKGYVIADVKLAQKSPGAVRTLIKETAALDKAEHGAVKIRLPQDPGQAGKAQAQEFRILLDGYAATIKPVTGDKETRAEPYAVQVEGQRVFMLRGDWNDAYTGELRLFPAGKYADQVDASTDAHAELQGGQDRTPAFAPVVAGKQSSFVGAGRG